MASEQKLFTPLVILRSDGQGYPREKAGSGPEPELVPDNDERNIRWRVQLGNHLKFQLAPPGDSKEYILKTFPDGYELRETKTASTNLYLWGHPIPSGRCFRSPHEFAPHLLWLVSASVDRNDCSCELCIDMLKAPRGASDAAAQGAGRGKGQRPASQRASNAAALSAQGQQALLTRPIYQPPNPSGVFRVAEMVWFKDRAWRLGIIVSIQPKPSNGVSAPDDNQYIFKLAPLGHAGLRKPEVAKEAAEMRPFLTFSVPDSPHFQGKSFNEVMWIEEAQERRRNPQGGSVQQALEILGLEASKVAARTINNVFSVFNRQPDKAQSGSGFSMEWYGGIFLGAEMIVLGDAVRVTPPPKLIDAGRDDKFTTVMKVDEIVLLVPHARNQAVNLQFRGTVYLLTRLLEREINPAAAAENLGVTFREEVDFRNSLLDQNEAQTIGRWTWLPMEVAALRNDDSIHGRFYVSHKLLHILGPDMLQQAIQGRAIQDATTLVNTRQQNSGGLPYGGRVPDRRTCFGASIAVGALSLPNGIHEDFAPNALNGGT